MSLVQLPGQRGLLGEIRVEMSEETRGREDAASQSDTQDVK